MIGNFLYHQGKGQIVKLSHLVTRGVIDCYQFVDPNTLNLDPDPEFWPKLDPDPDPDLG